MFSVNALKVQSVSLHRLLFLPECGPGLKYPNVGGFYVFTISWIMVSYAFIIWNSICLSSFQVQTLSFFNIPLLPCVCFNKFFRKICKLLNCFRKILNFFVFLMMRVLVSRLVFPRSVVLRYLICGVRSKLFRCERFWFSTALRGSHVLWVFWKLFLWRLGALFSEVVRCFLFYWSVAVRCFCFFPMWEFSCRLAMRGLFNWVLDLFFLKNSLFLVIPK